MWASDSPEAQPQTVLEHTVGISKQDHLPAAQISMCGSGIEGVNASGLRGRAAGGEKQRARTARHLHLPKYLREGPLSGFGV